MQMLGSMTSEYAELLTRLAVRQEPLEMGQELHVGQPFQLGSFTCPLKPPNVECMLRLLGEQFDHVLSSQCICLFARCVYDCYDTTGTAERETLQDSGSPVHLAE